MSKQISIPSISEDKLALHLLVQAALADVVQGSEGGLLHLDIQLPKAGGGGPQVTHTQGAQGPLPQAEQQHHHEGYIQVDVETNIQLDIFFTINHKYFLPNTFHGNYFYSKMKIFSNRF